MTKHKFPSRDEFYKTILKLRRERTIKKEGEYLGYLKEQKMRKKSRTSENTTKNKPKGRY